MAVCGMSPRHTRCGLPNLSNCSRVFAPLAPYAKPSNACSSREKLMSTIIPGAVLNIVSSSPECLSKR